MKNTCYTKIGLAGMIALGAAGVLSVTGCSHDAAAQSPQEVKSALAPHYSPEATAAGRAYQANDAQKQADMIQSKGGGTKTANP